MEIAKSFRRVAEATPKYKELSILELVSKAQQKDSAAVSHLGLSVFNMAMQIAHSKNCFIYGMAEVEEAYMHALTYSINHYNVEQPKSKFITWFGQCANSTFAQMHQSASAGKNRQLNAAVDLDDIQFAIPDDRKETPEDTAELSNLIDIVKSLAYKDIELSDDAQEKLRLEKRAKKIIQFVKLVTSNVSSFTEEELCLELRFLKRKTGAFEKSETLKNSSLRERFDAMLKDVVKEMNKTSLEKNSLSIKEYAERIKSGQEVLTKGLLNKYGIICDLEKLHTYQSDIKDILEYAGIVDVRQYQKEVDQAAYETMMQEAKIKQVREESKAKGLNSRQIVKDFIENPDSFYSDFRELERKIASKFLHSHPETEISLAM